MPMTIDDALRELELHAELDEQQSRYHRAERAREAHRTLSQALGMAPAPAPAASEDVCPRCDDELVPTGLPGHKRCASCGFQVVR